MTDADRLRVLSAESQRARAALAPYVPIIGPQLTRLRTQAPSYMVAALEAVVAALAQWEHDEREAKQYGG